MENFFLSLKKFYKSKYFRNIFSLFTGTAFAQIIAFAFYPIITRLYDPVAFGIYGVFTAITAVAVPVASLTYPTAIVIPEKDEEAVNIAKLSLAITLFLAIILTIIILFFQEPLLNNFNLTEIGPYLILVPGVMFFSAIYRIHREWFIRKTEFKIIALLTFLYSLFLSVTITSVGYFIPTATMLILVYAVGYIFQTGMFAFASNRKRENPINIRDLIPNFEQIKKLKIAALKYRDFPLYKAPQLIIQYVSQGLPVLMLSALFSPASAGLYTLCSAVLKKPGSLIGKSVDDVFYSKFATVNHAGGDRQKLLIKTTLGLAAIGIIPFGLIIIFGPWIFETIFGNDWRAAGEYARWLSIFVYFLFCSKPSKRAVAVLEIQEILLIYQVVSLVTSFTAIYMGYLYLNDSLFSIIYFSIANSILYGLLILYVIFKSK